MRYGWLLLDADNTIFDYDKAEAVALRATFEQAGQAFKPSYSDVYRQINGELWREFEAGLVSPDVLKTRRFQLLFEAVGLTLDPAQCSQRYLENLSLGTDLIDGAEELLAALHGSVGMVLITNGLTAVQRPRFCRSTVYRYFHDIVISEELGVAKPEKGIFDIAFSKMGSPHKREVLMVGDSLTSDIRGGSDYGIDTCWFNPDGVERGLDVEPTYEIRALRHLLQILEQS